jgi:glutamate 5-kinase
MRLVIKVGTQTLVTDQGHLNTRLLGSLVQWMATAIGEGHQLVLVTSGAVGLGRSVLKGTAAQGPQQDMTAKQAAAAVGQPLLMGMYHQLCQVHGVPVGQVLVSAHDFCDRQRYLNVQATLLYLMGHGVLPIVNENDVLSAAALQEDAKTHAFNDNDHLSAILAAKLNADRLVILTNVNGVYTANPTTDPTAQRIPRIMQLAAMQQLNVAGQSSMGRGGMASKLQAARLAAMSGVATWIAPHTAELTPCLSDWTSLSKAETPIDHGTWIAPLPQTEHLPERDQWIGYASGFSGCITLNAGAKDALIKHGASLLAVGITGSTGQFLPNQCISLLDEAGNELGRGLTDVSHQTVNQWLQQLTSPKDTVVVHRNNLVLFTQYQ